MEKEDKKIEEEIILVEENEFGEVTVKKSKKPTRKTTDKEKITEIIKETTVKKVRTKKIAAHKPTEDEEMNEEEITETLKPFKMQVQQEIILETPQVLSETIPTRQVPEIFSERVESSNINVNIIPLTAISKEEVLTEEKEQQYSKIAPTEFTANKLLSTIEAYQVSEDIVQNIPSTFEATFQPTLSKATKSVSTAESISVSEVHENQSTSEVYHDKVTEDTASVKFILQEAANVTETETASKETSFKEASLPQGSIATETYKTNESISVEQVQDLSTAINLETKTMSTVTSKINIDAIEPLVIQEVYTDSKPGKHLPEAFVPTEVANSKFIPQNQIIASEMVAPESEGEFIPGRLPPSQTASLDITAAESLLTEQVQTDDKESSFDVSLPQKSTASSELILLEGVTVSTTDSQMPSKEMETHRPDEQKAEIEILSKLSITTSTVIPSEDGKEYVPGELPESKIAATQISCLEVSSVSDIMVQESEKSLVEDAKPIMSIAEQSVRQIIPLEVSEIGTADVPDVFTNYPKYSTQEVTVGFEMQDAKQITETHAAETETKYEKTSPDSFTTSSTFTDAQQGVSVSEAKCMEREAELPTFQLPSSYKGKQIPSHAFPTSTTEEVTPQIIASDLSADIPESKTVGITQTTLEETIVSQAVVSDSLGVYEEKRDIKGTQADFSITMSEGITVTEVLTEDKERDYHSKESPKQYQASVDIDSRKAAHTAEVLPNFLPEQFEQKKPLQDQARPENVLAEGIQILQHQTAEKENEHKADVIPDFKYPTCVLETAKNELNVSETYVQESENEYTQTETPKGVSAIQNITTQEVAIKSETEIISHTDDIPDEEPITGKAKKYARPLQELIITEATAADFHKELPKDIFPNEKKVNVNLIPGQQLTVTEVVVSDREENLEDAIKPSTKQASTALFTREVAVQEETLSHITPGDFKYTSPATDTATAQQDVTHHITQLQLTIAEKESEYQPDIKPDSKVINIEFEQGKSVTVLEVQTQDKENILSTPGAPSLVQGSTQFVPCTVAVKSEVAPDDSLANIELPVTKTTEANITQSLLEGLIQTETKVEENESPFNATLPDAKNAVDSILLDDTITVSSTIAADKEQTLVLAEIPASSYAKFDFSEQTIAQTTEVLAGDTLLFIENETTQEAVAKTTHIEQHSITQSELTVGESENALPKDLVPDKKEAELIIDAISAATTEEVVTDEKEKILAESENPVSKCADENIDAQPVAETTVVILENTTKDVEVKEYNEGRANVVQSTFESILESSVTLGETETAFGKAEINTKQANINFNEDTSVAVTEITTADREQEHVGEIKPIAQLAMLQLDATDALQKEEISVHENLGDLTLEQPKTTSAQPYIQPFSSVITSENILQESEIHLKETAPADTKTAILNIPEDFSVTIESVQTAIKESTLDKLELPDTMQAETAMISLKSVAMQSEVFSDLSVANISEKPLNNINANVENIPFETITQLETVIAEAEDNISDYKLPDSRSALVNVEAYKGLEISQVTLNDTNEEYRTPFPSEKKVAGVTIDVEFQVTQSETTLVSEGLDSIQPKEMETFNASQSSSLLASLLISENVVQESEREFSDKFIAPASQALVSLETGKPVHDVTEIIAQEKETELRKVYTDEKKNVSIDFDTHKVPEIEEVIVQAGTEKLIETQPSQSVANVNTSDLEYIVQYQTETCEREADIDVTLKTAPKSADISLHEISSITVSEVHSTEKEKSLDSFNTPNAVQAVKQILEKEAMETSEVHSTVGLIDFMENPEKQYSANVKQEYLEGLTNNEIILIESEKDIDEKFTADSKQAEISLTEMSSVAVQETYIKEHEEEYTPSQGVLEHANQDYNPLQHLQATNIITSEDVSKLNIMETSPVFVNVEQTTLDSLALIENVIHEKETAFGPFEISETKTANTRLIEQETIGVTETLAQEKEDIYSAQKTAESQSAALSFIPQQSLQQHETEAQTALSELKILTPSLSEAVTAHTQQEAIEVSENTLHEQEMKFDTTQPDSKFADVEFLQQKYINVSETVAETKEANFEKQQSNNETTAKQDILPQSAVEVAEIIGVQSLNDLLHHSPIVAEPTASTFPHENVVVFDLIISEKENILQQQTVPESVTATTSLDATGQVAFTTEVTAETKELAIPNYQATHQSAVINVVKQTPLEETEVNALHSLEGLMIDESVPTRKATLRQSTLEGITQTDVAVQEKTKFIDTEYEDKRTAILSVETNESINIIEVQAEEHETDKVILGRATQNPAQSEIQGHSAAITEEIIAFQAPDTVDYKSSKLEVKAKHIEQTIQHGLVVSEQRSTGELESVPCVQKPDSKKGRVLYEDATTTPLISEIQLQEKEGKYFRIFI